VTTGSGVLEERLQQISDEVGRPTVEGSVRFEASGPEATFPKAGEGLDVEDATDAVVSAYPSDGEPVELELVDLEPELSVSEVGEAMRAFAKPAMAGPVTYRVGSERVALDPADYAPALSMEVQDGALEPAVDVERLRKVLDPALDGVLQAPQDATVRVVDGRPQVVPGQVGRALDDEPLGDSFVALVTSERRVARLPTVKTDPETTADEVRSLGVKQKVSEFTTYYPHADYRNVNIGRAAEIVDGTLLKPGETFSLNGTVGERTRENGFTEGFVINDGILVEDLGGGVSQMATTLFNAAFFAGLEDVEHKPHSFYIDRYPVGREATVAWPTVDLRFRNDTKYGVLIDTIHTPSSWSSSGAITVRMFSTKVWDVESLTSERYAYTSPDTRTLTGDDCVENSGYSGFQVDVTRVFRRPGQSQVHHTEKMHTTYIPSDTVICR
jgi:vancomycin resistance protein YoaR